MGKIDLIRSRILDMPSLERRLAIWRFRGEKIVFTNGCFDILHLGHIDYLSRAADLGDVLIVGLNADDSVRRLKGATRPVNDEHARAMVLSSLSFVTAVVLFSSDTPYELIQTIQPDVLVKGADYSVEEIAGHDIVISRGGQVVTIDLLPGYSSTDIIRKTSIH
ncbi:MAG: D-glycero-beta-D-manno-heptose 1-phosphate adenylyltransferase [Bacteroidales bacterium]|nr:D-glycero-beta-D-manno-heptose 1-phosphate adenylyltransferase [Lentimicrobiaceae bacterium]MDD5693926.1 D-glycero-beta-D-manno-heptose 1-phosphate adenylyltransferase [Bacteroidales bacterium]